MKSTGYFSFLRGDFAVGTKYVYRELAENKFHISVADIDAVSRHGHDFLEFSYITKGAMEHDIGGRVSVLNAGDYFIVDHGTEHAYRRISEEPLQVINLLFYPEFLERALAGRRSFEDVLNSYLLRFRHQSLHSSPTGKAFHDENGQLRRIVRELMEEYAQKKDGCIEYIRCLFVQMLILTMRKVGTEESPTKKSDEILEITEYVKENYAGSLQLSRFADRFGYSVSHLSRKFSGEMGMGFSEYVQRIRIEQSCRLLENSDLPVSEIAPMVGYDDLKFFGQVFRRLLGLTPREFRASRQT